MNILLELNTGIINDSLQVGDSVYYVEVEELGCFNQSTDVPTFIGNVINIFTDPTTGNAQLVVHYLGSYPPVDAFIMFGKNPTINLSGLVGYFAEVEIRNNSKEKAEMFSISSEISVSSK